MDESTILQIANDIGQLKGLVEGQHEILERLDKRLYGNGKPGDIDEHADRIGSLEKKFIWLGAFSIGGLVIGALALGKPELLTIIAHLL